MLNKIAPHPSLEKIVDYYWIEKEGKSVIKVLPDGTTSIMFNLGNPMVINNTNGEHKFLEENCVIGAHKRFYMVEKEDGAHTIGIKFKQGGAYSYFKFPVSQFSNKIINLNDILNGETVRLRETLMKVEGEQSVKRILDRYLLMKVDSPNGNFDIVDFAISKVKVNGSPALIKNLCQAANISNKHLISLFNEKVGLSPKLIYRINKFLKVVEMIQSEDDVNWQDIVYQCHYYDQAHLINDFKHFAGLSPTKYQRNENIDDLHLRVA